MHIIFTIISIIGLLLAITYLALLANTRKLLIGGADIDQFWPKRRSFMHWTNLFMLLPNAIYLFLIIASYLGGWIGLAVLFCVIGLIIDVSFHGVLRHVSNGSDIVA